MPRQNYIPHFHISKKRRITLFDKVVMVAAFLYPLSGLPQVIEVFQGNSAGVSLRSWLGFTAFSALFLVYGFAHKIKPMVITNALWLIVDGLIVIGILIDRMMA